MATLGDKGLMAMFCVTKIVTIIVIRMQSGLNVPLSLFSMLRSFEVLEISDNKVIGA